MLSSLYLKLKQELKAQGQGATKEAVSYKENPKIEGRKRNVITLD